MPIDEATCYSAMLRRDPRFDGVFYVAVTTTGVYCRPVCRAKTPRRDRCLFFARAAEAEKEGFRACFRCRPELAPGNGSDDATGQLVRAAVAAIDSGALNDGSLESMADSLGVTSRHLRRAVTTALGVAPVELAQSRRVAFAKGLLQDTGLSMTEIAHASGFGSVRRFNALVESRLGRPPSAVRRQHGQSSLSGSVTLRLDHRPPLAWDRLLEFLGLRAITGVESVRDGTYRRTVRLDGRAGWLAVSRASDTRLAAEVSLSLTPVLFPLVGRLRALFDLDARPDLIDSHLGADPFLAPSVAANPGLRVPGSICGFETAARAILGRRVNLRAATNAASRLAAAVGPTIETPFPELVRLFPTPEELLRAPAQTPDFLPTPAREPLRHLARDLESGRLTLDRLSDPEPTERRLTSIPGIGEWTAQYILMRAVNWPDAFPGSDLVLSRRMAGSPTRTDPKRWRPWRAYAAIHLWTSHSD